MPGYFSRKELVGAHAARVGEGFDAPPMLFVDADVPPDGLCDRRCSLTKSAVSSRLP